MWGIVAATISNPVISSYHFSSTSEMAKILYVIRILYQSTETELF